jgi:pSer/pThr/pTyr-binding forkhead associated (FHA) protein
LTKAVTTVGSPGTQVIAIARQTDRYIVRHVEGKEFPKVNGQLLSDQPHTLQHGDVIDISGTHMQFSV